MSRLFAVSDGLGKQCTIEREQFAELLGLTRIEYVKGYSVGRNFLKQNQIINLTLDKAVADADIWMLFNKVVLRAETAKGAAAECFLDTGRTAAWNQSACLFSLASCLRSGHSFMHRQKNENSSYC